jgi:dynein heavy chain
MDMYRMLESYLPAGFMEKEETDKKTVLETNWKKLLRQAEMRTEELSKTQTSYKRTLLRDIKEFKIDVEAFQDDFKRNGPTVDGIKPEDAVDRLNRFKEELKIRERKEESYQGGEELFALPITEYPALKKTGQELSLADKLFGLYVDVLETESDWREILWSDVAVNIQDMADKVEGYAQRMKKLPRKLKDFSAYTKLKDLIENFQIVIPLLQEFTKESIRDRHWDEVAELVGAVPEEFEYSSPEFKLSSLLAQDLAGHAEDIEEITDGADKQLKIERGLEEIEERWSTATLSSRNGVVVV